MPGTFILGIFSIFYFFFLSKYNKLLLFYYYYLFWPGYGIPYSVRIMQSINHKKIASEYYIILHYIWNNLSGIPFKKWLIYNFYSSSISFIMRYVLLNIHCRWDIVPCSTSKISFLILKLLFFYWCWKASLVVLHHGCVFLAKSAESSPF